MLDGSTWGGVVPDDAYGSEVRNGADDSRGALHARFLRRKRRQSAWDAEESRDLRVAERLQIWTHFGCVTLLEYLEVFCGIEPRTALERIRVSMALAELPLLEAELEDGTFAFSHVKELTRIVVPDTEVEWLAHTRGMTYREVQQSVAGHVRGDRPTDPTQADERRGFIGFHVKPSTAARLRSVLKELEAERGDRFTDDDDKVHALCDLVSAPAGEMPPTEVWITPDGHGFAHGVELDDAELATLTCDATIMGHVDDPHARAQPTITKRMRKRIRARDANCCTVPGCRSRRYLDVHHIIHREDGGDDADENLLTLCRGHHRLHHAGLLDITGRAPNELTFRRVNADEIANRAEVPSRPRGHDCAPRRGVHRPASTPPTE
jgi:hypothetical protein